MGPAVEDRRAAGPRAREFAQGQAGDWRRPGGPRPWMDALFEVGRNATGGLASAPYDLARLGERRASEAGASGRACSPTTS